MFPRLNDGVILRKRNNTKCKSDADNVAVAASGESYFLTPEIFCAISACNGKTRIDDIPNLKDFIENTPEYKELISLHESSGEINPNQVIETNGLVAPCRRAIWHLTRQCNMHCSHCYYLSKVETKIDFSADEIKKIAANLAALGVEMVRVSGGEATFDLDRFALVVNELTREYCIPIVLNTNGWKWQDRTGEVLGKNPFVRAVQVSLDGPARSHNSLRGVDSHREIMVNIARYCKLGIHVRVISMLTEGWIDKASIREMCEQIAKLGISDWVVEIPSKTGRWTRFGSNNIPRIVGAAAEFYAFLTSGRHSLRRFAFAQVFDWPNSDTEPKSLTDQICSHDLDLLTFGPEGASYCTMFAQQFGISLERLGHMYSDRFAEIWNTIAGIRMSRTISENPACGECDLFPVCQGGCPGQYSDASNFLGCDPHSRNLAIAKLKFSKLLSKV